MAKRLQNIIGLKYGRLTITGDAPRRRSIGGTSQRFVFAKCDCGKEVEAQLNSLTRGNTKSCGCGKLNGSKLNNEIYDGFIFNKLMVIREVKGKRKPGGSVARVMECECECGTIKEIRLGDLKNGRTTSCGCVARQRSSEANAKPLEIGHQRGSLVMLGELDKVTVYNDRGKVMGTIRYVEVECRKCGSVSEMTVFRFSNDSQPVDCGCGSGERISNALKYELEIGKKYERLTILKEVEPINSSVNTNGKSYARRRVQCQCDCGTIKDIDLALIRIGSIKSCGCLMIERVKETVTTHGLTTTPENRGMYVRWRGMMGRCYDSNNPNFVYYGARGIQICERWRMDIMNFINDMGYPPTSEHSLDRIDVDGNYELSNCRWATHEMQSMNKRSNKWYKKGEKNPTL